MAIKIGCAPCCWGVETNRPNLPPWERVLDETAKAGYKGIELGAYGFMPLDAQVLSNALSKHGLYITGGTVFDDIVSEGNFDKIMKITHDTCGLLSGLPAVPKEEAQKFAMPYLVLIDFSPETRGATAGHPDTAPRLEKTDYRRLVSHLKEISKTAWDYGIRTVIHPHAGGYIEFADEVTQLMEDIPYETAGWCLDSGHMYYSGMDPVEWFRNKAAWLDYVHFKDINLPVYREVIKNNEDFFTACSKGVMCPIGKGVIDYDGINKTLKQINYNGFITIEQERDPSDAAGALKDISESLNYLVNVGYSF